MFKQRLLTALLLIPLVLLGIYYAPPPLLAVILALLVAGLAWEWAPLVPIRSPLIMLGFVLITLGITCLMLPFLQSLVRLDIALWIALFCAIVTYPASARFWGYPWLVVGLAWFLIPLFASSFWSIYHSKQAGPDIIVYGLCLVWATDIGAYWAGKQYGRQRLIPKVSPGKTRIGVLGGALLAMLVAVFAGFYCHPQSWIRWLLDAVVMIAIAMIGDLFISMLKRRCQVKDTGHILPGHGGLLDRMDSLLAVMPFLYIFHVSAVY